MIVSRKKLLLSAVACLVMAPLPVVTGMGEDSPARLASFLGAIPVSVWMGLLTMLVLVIVSWFSIDEDGKESGE